MFFLSNPGSKAEAFTARFRSTGKRPELWNAKTGTSTPLGYRIEGSETLVSLTLAQHDAVFVVFREDAAQSQRSVVAFAPVEVGEVNEPWTVSFQLGIGAPASLAMERLAPLHESAEPGIRYVSGVASYTNRFTMPKGWKPGQPLWLNLGAVSDIAEVWVNGQRVGGLWRAPGRIDVGSAVRKGANAIEIRVANKWVNRLIGDAQPGATKIARLAAPGYRPDAPLRPSGLVGPVTLELQRR